MTAMRIRRTYLTALATAPAAAAAILAALIASPPHVQLSSAPIHNAPLDDLNIPGVPGNIDFDVPDINVPDVIDVPNVNVPNINLPNINPGHVGAPGRGR
jgi:hypothetical protein